MGACDEVGEELGFEPGDAVVGVKYALFLLLELGGDVALGVDEGLLADPVRGDAVFVGVADLEVVAKDVVEVELERGDSTSVGFCLKDCFEDGPGVALEGAVAVEFGVDAGSDGSTFGQQDGGLGRQAFKDVSAPGFEGVEGGQQVLEGFGSVKLRGEFVDSSYGVGEGAQVARAHAARSEPRGHALEVGEFTKDGRGAAGGFGVVEGPGDGVVPEPQGPGVEQRHGQPATKEPRAHRVGGSVEHVDEADSAGMGGAKEFKVPHRESIHPQVGGRAKPLDALNVRPVGVLCLAQVVQKGSDRDDGERSVVEAEAFEGRGSEVLRQRPRGKLGGKHPVLEPAGHGGAKKATVHARSAVEHHLAGLKGLHPGVDFAQRSLGGKEFAGGHVDEGKPQ